MLEELLSRCGGDARGHELASMGPEGAGRYMPDSPPRAPVAFAGHVHDVSQEQGHTPPATAPSTANSVAAMQKAHSRCVA